MQTRIYLKAAILVAVVFWCNPAFAAAEKVASNEQPPKVLKTLTGRFSESDIVSAEKETEGGKVVYDIELKQKGRKFEADIQDDGTLLEIEKQVVEKKWSKELLAGLKAAHPNPHIVEVMKVLNVRDGREVPDHFEVTIKAANDKVTELLFALDGKPIKEETASDAAESTADEKVALDKVPRAVKAAIETKFPKAKIESAEKGQEDGKQIYEVSLRQGKHNIEVTLVPDGTILSYEKAISASEMPNAMSETLKSKYPQATVKLVEEIWEHGKLTGFEATIVTNDKKTVEVVFDPKGKMVSDKSEG